MVAYNRKGRRDVQSETTLQRESGKLCSGCIFEKEILTLGFTG